MKEKEKQHIEDVKYGRCNRQTHRPTGHEIEMSNLLGEG